MSDQDWSDLRWRGGPPVPAAEAMGEWVAMLRPCDPWDEMFLDDLPGEFRAVFEELLHTADDTMPGVRAARLRHAARQHGAFRRRQGCPAFIFRKEVAFAERAIAVALARAGAAPALVMAIQNSFTPLMRAVVRATYGGYVDWAECRDKESGWR